MYKFFQLMSNVFKILYQIFNSIFFINDNHFNKIDENLIRYFRTEYGSEWKIAAENYLRKNNKN